MWLRRRHCFSLFVQVWAVMLKTPLRCRVCFSSGRFQVVHFFELHFLGALSVDSKMSSRSFRVF